ncbi:hypothetical protein GGR57DRAFT_373274 [Xylariaceae sp. FL1272]|nr:hypothetical protein GGR57DRAFT_373274 [Xylariaceae sp. FL1272]
MRGIIICLPPPSPYRRQSPNPSFSSFCPSIEPLKVMLKKKPKRNENIPSLKIQLVSNFHACIIDKSGNVPFKLYAYVQRLGGLDRESDLLVFPIAGSVFDLKAGFEQGLIELHDETTDETVDVVTPVADCHEGDSSEPGEDVLVELPPKSVSRRRAVQVQFHNTEVIRHFVELGHEYTLRIKELDLGIKWWSWCPADFTLVLPRESTSDRNPPLRLREPSKNAKLRVVESIPLPPKLEIRLSLAITPKGPAIVVQASNPNPEALTIRVAGDHRYLLPPYPMPGNNPIRKANVLANVAPHSTSPTNFIVTEIDLNTEAASDADKVREDGEVVKTPKPSELFPEHWVCTLTAPGHKPTYRRREFVTLAPDNSQTITRLVHLPQRIFKQPETNSESPILRREFRIELRSMGCWWMQGTMDDIFGVDNDVLDHWPTGNWRVLPLLLESDDVLTLEVEYGETV